MMIQASKIGAATLFAGSLFHFSAHGYVYAETETLAAFDRTKEAIAADIASQFGYEKPQKQLENYSIQDKIELEATVNGLHPDLLRAVIKQESTRNPWAVSGVGAKGLMQLMPDTARACGMENAGEAYVPERNIECGAYWLQMNIKQEKGDLIRGLESYNGGPKCAGGKCKESIQFARNVLKYFYSRSL